MKLEKYYKNCRQEIRLADRISNKHFLEYPWHHSQRIAAWFLGQPFKEPDLTFLNLCRKIAIKSYQEIEHEIQPIHNLLNRWINEWVDDLNSIISGFREKLGLENISKSMLLKVKEYWVKQLAPKRKQRMWIAFCDHFSLSPQLKDYPSTSVYDNFHSFRYWVDYRLAFENKLIFENKMVESGDYLDWEQTVYLNIMDYFVTEDKNLISIFQECGNEEMHGRTISFDEFIVCLKGELPPKRAPDTTTEKWYPAQ